jgi:outer membrane lipoprotein-sorting protein
MNKIAAALASSSLLLVSNVHAQLEDLQPRVSFSAWRVMTAADAPVMEGPYYYAPGKHRSEMTLEGQTFTAIIREDREVLWTLMPQQNMYLEVSFDAREFGNGGAFEGSEILESRELGSEEVNGQRTTKYEVTVRDPSGETASGTLWATRDMIPVKMDMVVDGGDHVVLELRDIEVGSQPDSLFEVPAGYTALSLGSLGGLRDIAQAFPGAQRQPGSASQPGGPSESDNPNLAEEVAEGAADGAREAVTEGVRDGVRENVGRRIRGIFNRD